jgi:nucleoside-diphosphate-sugar epimerase
MARTLEAIRRVESMVLAAPGLDGVVLRYGAFYGPGTALALGGELVEAVRKRRFPIVGGGTGVWSFVHVADVAEATRIAIEGGPAGLYNIVDDDPAEVAAWLPELARAVGSKPPYHVPTWLGRLVIGEAGVRMMTEQRGSSNAKAKRLMGWRPAWASWREGFHRGLAAARAA